MSFGDYLMLEQLAAFFNVPVATMYFIQTVIGVAIVIIVFAWLRHKNIL